METVTPGFKPLQTIEGSGVTVAVTIRITFSVVVGVGSTVTLVLVTVYVVSVTVIVVATTTLTISSFCTLGAISLSATAPTALEEGQKNPAHTVGAGRSGGRNPHDNPMQIVPVGRFVV